MIRNTIYLFSHISNYSAISSLNQLSKNHLENFSGTNLWQIRRYNTRKNRSSVYAEKLESKGINFNDLTKGDPVLEKRLKLIILEVENERYDGNLMLEHLNIRNYKEMIEMDEASDRKDYLLHLTDYLKKRETNKLVKRNPEIVNENLIHNHIYYSLHRNTLFSEDLMKKSHYMLDSALATGLMFGENIVIDCSYDDLMKDKEIERCAYQLINIIYSSKMLLNPFNIHFCNVEMNGKLMKMINLLGNISLTRYLVNIHTESYLDIFDRDQLVYLSPDAKDELVEYNPNKVYIIGGLVDREPVHLPHSLEKVKTEDIEVRRLPVAEYVDLTSVKASQSFHINTTFQILAAMNYFRDWKKAFQYLPYQFKTKFKKEKTEHRWRNLHSLLDN